MSRGTSFAKARVTIAGQQLDGVLRAIIENDTASLTDREGNVIRTMNGPVTVTDATLKKATWSNGEETWLVRKAGCSCNDEAS